ncbi:MAG: GFA family protein [Deltaproteobacteria bacterium]|nr:GFA family protein [Deltaproteobacteria bacterium]
MHRASCLCGGVTWQLDGPLQLMSHCHCSRCRKTHGTAFATYVAGAASGFRLDGAEHVGRWESSPGFSRNFCRRCGSVVPGAASDGQIFAPAGNFLDDPAVRPLAHIFVASKAPWYEIHDALPRFDAYPDGFDAPVVADRPPLDPPGRPRGSCLCGGVSFVVDGEPLMARACHCGRCRRARSAAHATNMLTRADGVRFTRGADLLATYKVPEARFFSQTFCRVCGSAMPRIDASRNLAIIPLGAMDDDPGMRPQEHIFVESKAPWFDIPDDGLPRRPEGPPPV